MTNKEQSEYLKLLSSVEEKKKYYEDSIKQTGKVSDKDVVINNGLKKDLEILSSLEEIPVSNLLEKIGKTYAKETSLKVHNVLKKQ